MMQPGVILPMTNAGPVYSTLVTMATKPWLDENPPCIVKPIRAPIN